MINIGIYVRRKTCEATIKSDSGGTIERAEFRNDKRGIEVFAERVKKVHGDEGRLLVGRQLLGYAARHAGRARHRHRLGVRIKHRGHRQANVRGGRSDSEVLADLLRTGLVRESFVPEERYRNPGQESLCVNAPVVVF